jgi:hypothetical protein
VGRARGEVGACACVRSRATRCIHALSPHLMWPCVSSRFQRARVMCVSCGHVKMCGETSCAFVCGASTHTLLLPPFVSPPPLPARSHHASQEVGEGPRGEGGDQARPGCTFNASPACPPPACAIARAHGHVGFFSMLRVQVMRGGDGGRVQLPSIRPCATLGACCEQAPSRTIFARATTSSGAPLVPLCTSNKHTS